MVEDVASPRGGSTAWSGSTCVERDERGRALVCDTVNDAKFTKVRCRVRVDYDPPHRLTFTRVESDDVDEMEASWELEEIGPGRTRTAGRPYLRCAVDPGPCRRVLARPLAERALRPLVVWRRVGERRRGASGRRGG